MVLNSTIIIGPSSEARNLGFVFDTTFKFTSQISKVRSSAFYQLRRLQFCREFIPSKLLGTLVHAFITSRLDFCNSLYYGLPLKQLNRLQAVQNAAARFLTGGRKFDSSKTALHKLHWLPVRERICFKIASMAYHCCHNSPGYPGYFSHIISRPIPSGTRTRASYTPQLCCSFRPSLKSYGCRSFSVSSYQCFNSIPSSIRSIEFYDSFKSNLKTYLFSQNL